MNSYFKNKINYKERFREMAKKLISETRNTVIKLSLEGFLNIDNLEWFNMEFEDEGEKSVTDLLKKYNGQYGTLTFTVKEQEDLSE